MKLVDTYIKTVREIKALQNSQKKMRVELLETINGGGRVDGRLGSVLRVDSIRSQLDIKKLKLMLGDTYKTFCEDKNIITLKIV